MSEPTTHRIDANDTVVFVDDAWIRFGQENDLLLNPLDIVGEKLWKFIADAQTRELYFYLLKRTREERIVMHVPFRCDGPGRRRHMELTVRLRPAGHVEFQSIYLRDEDRVPISLFGADALRSSDVLNVCSWCKKVEVSSARWLEVEDAITELNLFDAVEVPQLRHCNCPTCVENIRREIIGSKSS